MTHPIFSIRPLVHALAAMLLCPVSFAKTKNKAETAKPAATSKDSAGKTSHDKRSAGGTNRTAKEPAAKSAAPVKQPASVQQKPPVKSVAQPQAAVRPQLRQTQGDGPRLEQSLEHKALIVPREELLARVPTAGRLDEEDCILLAIANSPELARRRAAIQTAIADRQAEKDWENPELRLSYGSQSDDYLRNPYTERSIETLTETEEFDSVENETSLANPGEFGFGEAITDRETGTTTTTRYREVERLVTPGRYGDTVTTNVYETRDISGTGIRDRTVDINGFIQTRRDALTENVERSLRSTATETTLSSAGNGNQETFSAVLRLQMPHPWVKKAKLQRAAAEIILAEAQYLSDEDKLVRDVRTLFHDLSLKESTLKAHQRRRQNFSAFRAELDSITNAAEGNNANLADFTTDAVRASIDIATVLEDALDTGNDADELRAALARLCGIRDSNRIYSPGFITRRVLDTEALGQSYLVEMAMLYRADAVESRGRLGIAKALLAEANAAKIPWASFIDAGYTRQWRDGYSGAEDEWMIRVGFEIPVFDWVGINKRGREYKKAAVAWEQQFNVQRERVEVDVALALARVRRAYASLYGYDNNVKNEQKGIRERLAKSAAMTVDVGGFSKNLRMKYDAEDAMQILEIGRYRAYSDYNKALMELEETIGIRIEKVLSASMSK
jgi:outer membrane protein TolC